MAPMSNNNPVYDIRVRERNLKKGLLEHKEVDKLLKDLVDVGDQCELVETPQPALGNGRSND